MPVLWLVLLLTFPGSTWAQPSAPSNALQEGEDLIYNVRYGPFNLGSVHIRTLQRKISSPYVEYYCRANIDSYPKVPFVDLHATFDSEIDSAVYSHHFVGKLKQDDFWSFARYTFDYKHKMALIEKGDRDTNITKRDTMTIDGVIQDGLSLFFYARDQLFSKKQTVIPTLINEQRVLTRIDFSGKRDAVEIDAVDYPIDAVGFDGIADFVGIFGLSGDFEGWFSNDDARVPIMAKMKVLVGNVTIELMQWKRSGWVPPRAKE
jgi:hypothetical protein